MPQIDWQKFHEFKYELSIMLGELDRSPKFHEFKYELNMMLSAMDRLIRSSHPPVGIVGSQCGEDEIIGRLLQEPTGFYVDVGAGSPVECSNTFKLYQRGWRGLLVECLPSAWHALLRHRPGDLLSPLAALDTHCFARLRVADSVSSIRPDWDIAELGEVIVECDTLANILAPFPEIRDGCSLLSIDVEGAEALVIKGIDWNTFHPKVIIVEKIRYHHDAAARAAWLAKHGESDASDDLSPEWHGMLTAQGYLVHQMNHLNRIYVK